MDDTSVFRRFFVISNLITEIMQSFTGAMLGGAAESEQGIENVGSTTAQRYGEDPFSSNNIGRESSMPDMNEQINDAHNFPS